jgi:MFS family permease
VRPEAAAPGSLLAFARAAPLIALMVLSFALVDAAAIALLPVYFVAKGLGAGLAASTVTALFLGVLGTMPVIGLALDRFDRTRVTMVCALTAGGAAALIPFLPAGGLLVWPVLFVCGGAFSGIYTCALTALGEGFKGGLLVAGSAVIALSYAAGGAAGPPIAGALMQWTGGEALPLLFTVVFAALAAALWSRGRRT